MNPLDSLQFQITFSGITTVIAVTCDSYYVSLPLINKLFKDKSCAISKSYHKSCFEIYLTLRFYK